MSEPLSDTGLRALVDWLLLEQGRLDPFELLLAAGMLAYEDYEAWRMGRLPDMQGAIGAAPGEAAGLLERAAAYAQGQKLASTPLEHSGWGSLDQPLRIGTDADLTRGCAVVFAPRADRHQLDLFHDSSALLLEEEIRRALAERRTDAAREQIARLMAQDPRHRHLRGFLRLIETVDGVGSGTPKSRLRELETVEPLARELLGFRARDFLAPLWSDLADSLAGHAFNPGSPRLHASFAWAGAGRWEAVREVVEQEHDWRTHPVLLLTHAEACWRRRDAAAAWRDWLWLCWEFPFEAERALASPTFPDQRLANLWKRFGDADLELETEDFPAWLLLADAGTSVAVPAESAPPDDRGEAYGLLHRLVRGDEAISVRRELAETHPCLLRLYLSGRR